MTAATLLLLRHGESTFNAAQVFTGLLDPGLSPAGEAQVIRASALVRAAGLRPTRIVTSPMRRALETTALLNAHLGLDDVPVTRTWRLAERDYGCLTGVPKSECRERWGDVAFHVWRRTMTGCPPPAPADQRASWREPPPLTNAGPLVAGDGESLADVIARIRPLWERVQREWIQRESVPRESVQRDTTPREDNPGACLAVVAHGNSLRALATLIDALSDEEAEALNIPAGHPLVYEFADGAAHPRGGRYLDEGAAALAADAVAAEGGT